MSKPALFREPEPRLVRHISMKSWQPKTNFRGQIPHHGFTDVRRCCLRRAAVRLQAPQDPNPGSSRADLRARALRRALPIRRWEELAFRVPLARVVFGTRPKPPARRLGVILLSSRL